MCTLKRKAHRIFVLLLVVLVLFLLLASTKGVTAMEDHQKVLVVFSSETGEIDQHQRILDLLIGHFTEDITFKNSSQVEEKDLEQVDYLFAGRKR